MRIHDYIIASMAVNKGLSLYVVQHLLGHASPQTTQRYAHLNGEVMLDAYQKVAEIVNQASIWANDLNSRQILLGMKNHTLKLHQIGRHFLCRNTTA